MISDLLFSEFAAKHRQKILVLCLRMLKNKEDAEDTVQEALLSAYRNLHKFEGRSSFYSWLYRIAYNECLMLLRSKKGKEFCELLGEIP